MSGADGTPIAVVTGASAGVGRATAVAFAHAGYDVALLARGRAGLEGASKEVEAEGRRALVVPTDVADQDAVRRAAQQVEDELGAIDVWVNDAMTTTFAPSWELEPADFARAVEVTFLGQVWGTLAALHHMRPRDAGTIVNVGSALAFVGIPLQSAYCSSKFACRGFAESVRAELLHEGSHVRLRMVHLPAVNTPQFSWCKSVMDRHPMPVPPIYQPEQAAQHILMAATSGSRAAVLGSWNRLVVLAGRFVPGIGNHYAALGAWGTQLTDKLPADPGRPFNLHQPVDELEDHGTHGVFDDQAHGFLSPSFLKTLPHTGALVVKAAGLELRERYASARATFRRIAEERRLRPSAF